MITVLALLWIHLVVQFVVLPKFLVIRGAPKNIDVVNGSFWYSVSVTLLCIPLYNTLLQSVQVFVLCVLSFTSIEWFSLPVLYRYWYSGSNAKYGLITCMGQSAHASVLVLIGGLVLN